ncbi:hypothetical protein B0T22DRAFT_241536 [Podospora appendiculata]|uniref:Uncharacterized protein n=1 Tax=Podospora appendiculata TaxID=314037 RepID=A0AAE0X6I8_9PEZI|nr:hypothetical protein B0T22DRAFT_241536 [Podospora appendiculata]
MVTCSCGLPATGYILCCQSLGVMALSHLPATIPRHNSTTFATSRTLGEAGLLPSVYHLSGDDAAETAVSVALLSAWNIFRINMARYCLLESCSRIHSLSYSWHLSNKKKRHRNSPLLGLARLISSIILSVRVVYHSDSRHELELHDRHHSVQSV